MLYIKFNCEVSGTKLPAQLLMDTQNGHQIVVSIMK